MHPQPPHHALAKKTLATLRLRHEALCVAPQNLIEFWAVATLPQNENGLGMTVGQAADEVRGVQDFFRLLPYTPAVTQAWIQTVTSQGMIGKQTHDAHLAAIMIANAVQSILTFNTGHFSRYTGITAIDPAQLQ